MYVVKKTYPVMQGEPHLGSTEELELVAKKYEVEDWILEQVKENGSVDSEYFFGEYSIDPEEYIDVELVNDYMAETAEEDITEIGLFTAAFVDAPAFRSVK